ncbi:MAG TPA: alkaline phosphatase [Terriglobales bacterium]|nr:alkaline phosphatase [Terriglobales bacterium]
MQIRPVVQSIVAAAMILSLAFPGHLSAADRSKTVEQSIEGGRAKNVILFLGDGMGDSEITIARNYHVGAAGRLVMDSLPLTGAYTTFAVEESDPSLPNYVTDSAASGTGWSTGHKTSNGRVSTLPGTNFISPIPTILELAQQAGYLTGDVSTAELTDATPAVLASHVNARGCQGPSDMSACAIYKKSNGGPGSIAEQLVDHKVDVLLGGGRQRFAQKTDAGPTVIEHAQSLGYRVIADAAALSSISKGQRVLGLFNNGNMSLEWSGQLAQPGNSGPQRCLENQRPSNEPSLADMTRKALELLDRSEGNGSGAANGKPGFFLQVEGASIDKQDHAENPCGQIGETIAFDAAIAVGLEYAKLHPDTLIIVTADHAHTSQIVDPGSKHPGSVSILTTADGANMYVSYATEAHGVSQDHTGSQVRIAAQGPQAANVVGVSDQTDLFHTMARALGLE